MARYSGNNYLQFLKRFALNHLKLLATLLGMIVIAGILGWSISSSPPGEGEKSTASISPRKPPISEALISSNALPPSGHDPEREDCQSCHSPADGANEGLFFDDEIEPLASGSGTLFGYGSTSSVPQGGSIDFHVSATTGVTTYDIQIFRFGANQLDEPIRTITDLSGGSYQCGPTGAPAGQEEVELGCNWPVAYTLDVPADWSSGIYVANLLDEDDRPGRWGSYIFFIVTEDEPGSTADILFQVATNNWQAYNEHGGWSLYTDPRAVRITFDRPYKRCDPRTSCQELKWESPLARWLESEGYTVEYAASEDIHSDPTLLFNYKLFLIVGHDEYWTKEARDNIDAFIDAGGNVAILSGNTGFRQVRYEDGGRTLIGYKSDWSLDPLYGVDNIRVTTEFKRKPVPDWPQNSTIGLGWTGWVNDGSEKAGHYTVYRSGHWVYAGTGLQDGDQFWYEPVKHIEVDGTSFTWQNGLPVVTGEDGTPLNFTILGVEPSTKAYATMGIYSRDGGGTVFNAATMGWARGLWPENNPDGYETVRQITRNIVNTLLSGGPPPPPIYPVTETSFTYSPTTPLEDEVLTFTASITPVYASPPITYTWWFDDGESAISTTSNIITHTYDMESTYTVTVTAASPYGQSSYSQSIVVMPMIPVEEAMFNIQPVDPQQGKVVTFTAHITPLNASLPITYTWQFNDGASTSSTASNIVTHTYGAAGTNAVTLTAANAYGQSSYSQSIVVVAPVEETTFNIQPVDPQQGKVVTFTALITPLNASPPITYTWGFGDSPLITLTTSDIVSHTYEVAGTNVVTLTAANAYGQSSYSQTIVVVAPVEEAMFNIQPVDPQQGKVVTFTAHITPLNASPPITYTWGFGDSPLITLTTSDIVSHTYEADGTYTVTLTVANTYKQSFYSQSIVVAAHSSSGENNRVFLPLVIKNSGD